MPTFDHRRDVACESCMPQTTRTGVHGTNVGEEARDGSGCRVGEKDGAENLVDADETRGLPGASADAA